MKKILFVIGVVITAFALLKILAIFVSGLELNTYGKGYLTGMFILLGAGLFLMFRSRRGR